MRIQRTNSISFVIKIGLKRRFALTEGDNQLVFDRNDAASVELFTRVIKGKTLVVLTEVFIDHSSEVINSDGGQYIGQFIASVFAPSVTYPHNTPVPANP